MVEAIPTICEWAGSRDAFARWLDRFYDLVEAETPDIAALFGEHVSREHREHVTDWWTEVMGGPAVSASSGAATSTCSPVTAASRSRPSSAWRS